MNAKVPSMASCTEVVGGKLADNSLSLRLTGRSDPGHC